MNIFRPIKNFSAFVWMALTAIRNAMANLVLLVILIIVVTALLADKDSGLTGNAVLVLDPSGILVEDRTAPDPAEAFLRKLGRESAKGEETRTQDLIDAIHRAARDPRIQAIVIDASKLQGCDTTKIIDIGKAIRQFKDTGKPVLAHSMLYTQGQYLLSSYADSISLNPLGGVLINGFGMYPTYLKGLLDKTKVNFHVFRVGDYKTAMEPLIRDSMSPQARESGRKWLDGLWSAYLREAAKNRGVSSQSITEYAENIDSKLAETGGDAARLAVLLKLVDEIKTSDQFEQTVADKTGQEFGNINRINVQDYLQATRVADLKNVEQVGIIRARGAILPGKQPENMTGSASVAELFQQARQDSDIVAVVLRLDSPGGSAAASEEIHREITRTQEAGKPVVVSMGSMAASGAYWIATSATRVVAAPTTLTGSIGIFAAIPTFENTAQSLGITSDGIGTTPLADLGNPLRPLAPQAAAAMQHLLNFGYDVFLDRVSAGRRMGTSEVQNSARGQVFMADEALARGLIDQIGDLDDALKIAASLAGLSSVHSRELRRELSPHEKFLQAFLSSGDALFSLNNPTAAKILAMVEGQAGIFETLADPSHIYALSLECEAARF
jgi:protease-4